LLAADGVLRRSETAAFILIRWSDLAGTTPPTDAARELSQVLNSAGGHAVVFLCPEGDADDTGVADSVLRATLDPRFEVVDAREIFDRYDVSEPHDASANAVASVPYTMEAFAAFSAAMMRRAYLALRPPVKMLAVDCDNTLWQGVVGEDGVRGVCIGAGRQKLQFHLKEQAKAGRILALLSKNEERDVLDVFGKRSEMALSLDDILACGVNWRAKSKNLRDIAGRFGVGEDAIVVLDDNALELAEIKSAAPAVSTAQVPDREDEIARFVDHFWPFDLGRATKEDETRLQMYREDAARLDEQRSAPSLKSFIDGLNLKVDIFAAGETDFARLSQLTQRTNQFNINLRRFGENDLRDWAAAAGCSLYGVSVGDRFGDYGVVGLIGLSEAGADTAVELFMLSCRALGRGVEHRMAAFAAAEALGNGAGSVSFDYLEGPRNEPARLFLTAIDALKTVAPDRLARLQYDPPMERSQEPEQKRNTKTSQPPPQADWRRIACELTSGAAILAAQETMARRARPALSSSFVAPAPGLERAIAIIWERVLGVAPVGANDPFAGLGGKSIQLVRIHSSLVEHLDKNIEFTQLFECATVAQLARRISQGETSPSLERAALMRAARRAHGQRLKAARGALS
jgi:FkbH-like protein